MPHLQAPCACAPPSHAHALRCTASAPSHTHLHVPSQRVAFCQHLRRVQARIALRAVVDGCQRIRAAHCKRHARAAAHCLRQEARAHRQCVWGGEGACFGTACFGPSSVIILACLMVSLDDVSKSCRSSFASSIALQACTLACLMQRPQVACSTATATPPRTQHSVVSSIPHSGVSHSSN